MVKLQKAYKINYLVNKFAKKLKNNQNRIEK